MSQLAILSKTIYPLDKFNELKAGLAQVGVDNFCRKSSLVLHAHRRTTIKLSAYCIVHITQLK